MKHPTQGDAPQPVIVTTGEPLPEKVKAEIKSLVGADLDSIKVHRNSLLPAAQAAGAYAQGNDIHLAQGKEHLLAHEVWHVVQQAQGRVSPTVQTHFGLNTDPEALRIERELLAKRTPL
jgi:hypothetical protein